MRLWRLYTINKIVLEHGLDELIPDKWLPWYARLGRACIFWLRNKHKDKPVAVRLRLALQSLGPVFIKFGQMLSTRRDLLDKDMADELAMLQDKVPPFATALAKEIVKASLQLKYLEEVFADFSEQPLASASIAQVHTATLKATEQQVVVKVIRPSIRHTIEADIELLQAIAQAVQAWLPDGKRLRPVEVVEEYRKTIIDELDLRREAANGIQLRRNFEDSPALYVPEIYSEFCHTNVMVMERIYGVPISDIATLKQRNVDMKKLAERGVEVFFTQVFRDSFFHADMHPGNIFVSIADPQEPQYIAIDYGIVGTLNRDDKRYLAENFIAFFNRDYRKVAELHADSGWVPSDTNIDEFEVAIRTVCEPIFQKPLADISFGHVLLQLFNTARRFNMVVQPQLVLLQKTLLYIEGLGRQLYPQLDLWQTAKPFLENWMKQQVGFKAMYKKVYENLPYWSEKLPEMPDLLHDSLRQLKQLPELQQKQFELQQQQQMRAQKGLWYTLAGSTMLLMSVMVWALTEHREIAVIIGAVGLLGWAMGWRKSHPSPRHD
ncbi:ubiquinone biosynthesis regulatory protein kinase UbiB [Aestuariibacter salexigens]|uniref:ubiquinone biosynthesis regulatory protein kinase UbiB n=1 Tax=Aestuariibacter salexigens TaxID=226010 RepID=UPI00040D2234|nr:ubiquinone biosynthesis regulatory protein kinase UbiB [Aestuariibacter salexigens]